MLIYQPPQVGVEKVMAVFDTPTGGGQHRSRLLPVRFQRMVGNQSYIAEVPTVTVLPSSAKTVWVYACPPGE